MTEVEYVYEKPVETKKSHKKSIGALLLIVTVAVSAYLLYTNFDWIINRSQPLNETYTIDNQNYTIPSNLKGAEGIDYIRNNYASGLAQANELCMNQFIGNWVDNSSFLGCYEMQGFSVYYCDVETMKTLMNACDSIEGNFTCSPTQISCEV